VTGAVAAIIAADAVGIDFGTSYSSVSVGLGDHLFLVPDEQDRVLQPSVVHFPESGDPYVGWAAREKLVSAARTTVPSPKRMAGRAFGDREIAGLLSSAAYKTTSGPNDSILVEMHGHQYALGQVCAQIFRHLRDMAETRLDFEVGKAVVSVPVSFKPGQRLALQRSAEIAGFEVIALIEEPVAAAMAYGFGQEREEVVAVYDFGGGTFDFTVIDISGYSFEILARGGDSWLGGDDFDLALAGAVADAVWRATDVELRNRAVEWQRVLFACEQAKRDLTERDATEIVADNLIETPRLINLRQPIDRKLFEQLCGELFDRSVSICRTSMARAAIEAGDIDQVVVSGGISRIPFVRAGLSRFFKRDLAETVDPDQAICAGAGLRAAQLTGHPIKGIASFV